MMATKDSFSENGKRKVKYTLMEAEGKCRCAKSHLHLVAGDSLILKSVNMLLYNCTNIIFNKVPGTVSAFEDLGGA
jgi:hypothetical protein